MGCSLTLNLSQSDIFPDCDYFFIAYHAPDMISLMSYPMSLIFVDSLNRWMNTGCMSYSHGCITLVTHSHLVKIQYITDLLVLLVVWSALSSSVMRMGYTNRLVYHPEDKLGSCLFFFFFSLHFTEGGGWSQWEMSHHFKNLLSVRKLQSVSG